MNRNQARKIAETITNEQLQEMFNNAMNSNVDWKKVSIVNKGMTKGTAWNMLAKDFDINHKYHTLAKTNMVREFGTFLPDHLKPKKQSNKRLGNDDLMHQDPVFK